ncbi:MAG TPA: hypothetical protein V6C76_13975 [Drouetiella sp.]
MNTAKIDPTYLDLIVKFPLVPLRRKSEFDEAIKIMKELAYRRSTLTSGEADYLSVLGELIAQFERKLPKLAEDITPQEALVFLMESNNLAQADIVEFVGQKSNLSAFLNGHRGLSKRSACRLAEFFKVSPALFLAND